MNMAAEQMFYEVMRVEPPGTWQLQIRKDSSPSGRSKYNWRDLTWGRHVSVQLFASQEVEIIPARIGENLSTYSVLNVVSVVKCVDELRTGYVEKWTADSFRSDLSGQYKTLIDLVIDPIAAYGHDVFRIWGSASANIVISSRVKDALVALDATGIEYRCVSAPTNQ